MIRVLRIRERRGIGREERNEGIIKESKGKWLVLRISARKRSAIVLLISLGDQNICNCPGVAPCNRSDNFEGRE